MKLTAEQQKALRHMADAIGLLSDSWTDELGEVLSVLGLLPLRDLMEAEAEYRHLADCGELD